MTNSTHTTRNTATAESRSTHTQRTTVPRIIGAVAAIALLASGCGSRSAAGGPLTADILEADDDNLTEATSTPEITPATLSVTVFDTGVVLVGESRSRSDLSYTITPLDDTTDPIDGTTAESPFHEIAPGSYRITVDGLDAAAQSCTGDYVTTVTLGPGDLAQVSAATVNDTLQIIEGSTVRPCMSTTVLPLSGTESTSSDCACPFPTSAPDNGSLVTIDADGSLIPVD